MGITLRIGVALDQIDKFGDVEFDLFCAYAEDVRFEIHPTVLQVERKHFFVVGLLGDCNFCRRFEEQIEDLDVVQSARKVDIRIDVEFKTAVDIAQFYQRFDQNAFEQRADFLVGHIDFDFGEFAFEGFDVEGKSRGHVDVEQIRVERAVFENGEICALILFEFVFKFSESRLEVV